MPEGDINFFITHLINHAVVRLIEEIDRAYVALEMKKADFNAKE